MKAPILLSRDEFREAVFARDKHTCVFCDRPAVNAHHIMERRLFDDGGYYIDNGASVCGHHHLQCEMTLISTDAVREACGITRVIIPEHLYDDIVYDKWANCVLPNTSRLKGELFFDESVQKILKLGGVLSDFRAEVKYPRTHHVSWSQSIRSDDRVHKSLSQFHGKRVIITKKMDGENTSMYQNYIHARSIDGRHHISRDWIKNFWSTIRADIPDGWRVCCENMFAEHSIRYESNVLVEGVGVVDNSLDTYCMGFSIWNERNVCLSWDETMEWFELLGIKPVEVIYDGIYDEEAIKKLYKESDWATLEGWVMRIADEFNYSDFRRYMAKFVRKGHVQTEKHWMFGRRVKKNQLKRR